MLRVFSRVGDWWDTKPQQTRTFAKVLVPVGIALAAWGFWIDGHGGWDGHDFGLNIISSMTSLCFGAPAALLFFNSLGNAEVEARQLSRVRGRAKTETARLQELLLRPYAVNDLTQLRTSLDVMSQILEEMKRTTGDSAEREAATAAFFDVWNDLCPARRADSWPRLRSRPQANTEMREWRDRVRSQWKILYTDIRTPWRAPAGWNPAWPAPQKTPQSDYWR